MSPPSRYTHCSTVPVVSGVNPPSSSRTTLPSRRPPTPGSNDGNRPSRGGCRLSVGRAAGRGMTDHACAEGSDLAGPPSRARGRPRPSSHDRSRETRCRWRAAPPAARPRRRHRRPRPLPAPGTRSSSAHRALGARAGRRHDRVVVELAVQREEPAHHRQRQQVEPVEQTDDQQDAGDARGLGLELGGVDGLRPVRAGSYCTVNMM